MQALADALEDAHVQARVRESEAQVMWSKLVRLNALACTTSAYDKLLGEIRSTPALRADLQGAIAEAVRGARRGCGGVDPAGRSPSSTAPTPRSGARCSATSRRGARRSSTRSPVGAARGRPPRDRVPDDRAAGAAIATRAGIPAPGRLARAGAPPGPLSSRGKGAATR